MPTSAGNRDKLIDIQVPDGEPIPDGDGGFTQEFKPLRTGVFASIEPATARGLERFRSNTVISTASHIVTIPYIEGVTTEAQLLYGTRVLQVRGYAVPNEDNVEIILACEEIVK
jgi:head-tail adaptor